MSAVEEIFMTYCNFGAGNTKTTTMDSSKFKKLLKDASLLGKRNLTAAEMDMIFTRCCVKGGAKRMNVDSFKSKAIPLLATALYGSDQETEKTIEALCAARATINTKMQSLTGQAAKNVDRLNTSLTGSHRERFDKDGKGRGLEGRLDVSKNTGYVTGYKPGNSPR